MTQAEAHAGSNDPHDQDKGGPIMCTTAKRYARDNRLVWI